MEIREENSWERRRKKRHKMDKSKLAIRVPTLTRTTSGNNNVVKISKYI